MPSAKTERVLWKLGLPVLGIGSCARMKRMPTYRVGLSDATCTIGQPQALRYIARWFVSACTQLFCFAGQCFPERAVSADPSRAVAIYTPATKGANVLRSRIHAGNFRPLGSQAVHKIVVTSFDDPRLPIMPARLSARTSNISPRGPTGPLQRDFYEGLVGVYLRIV